MDGVGVDGGAAEIAGILHGVAVAGFEAEGALGVSMSRCVERARDPFVPGLNYGAQNAEPAGLDKIRGECL